MEGCFLFPSHFSFLQLYNRSYASGVRCDKIAICNLSVHLHVDDGYDDDDDDTNAKQQVVTVGVKCM